MAKIWENDHLDINKPLAPNYINEQIRLWHAYREKAMEGYRVLEIAIGYIHQMTAKIDYEITTLDISPREYKDYLTSKKRLLLAITSFQKIEMQEPINVPYIKSIAGQVRKSFDNYLSQVKELVQQDYLNSFMDSCRYIFNVSESYFYGCKLLSGYFKNSDKTVKSGDQKLDNVDRYYSNLTSIPKPVKKLIDNLFSFDLTGIKQVDVLNSIYQNNKDELDKIKEMTLNFMKLETKYFFEIADQVLFDIALSNKEYNHYTTMKENMLDSIYNENSDIFIEQIEFFSYKYQNFFEKIGANSNCIFVKKLILLMNQLNGYFNMYWKLKLSIKKLTRIFGYQKAVFEFNNHVKSYLNLEPEKMKDDQYDEWEESSKYSKPVQVSSKITRETIKKERATLKLLCLCDERMNNGELVFYCADKDMEHILLQSGIHIDFEDYYELQSIMEHIKKQMDHMFYEVYEPLEHYPNLENLINFFDSKWFGENIYLDCESDYEIEKMPIKTKNDGFNYPYNRLYSNST